MKPYQYSMLGLTLDIIGAFLVSVEAIKLENFRVFRDLLADLERYTQSPGIYFVDTKSRKSRPHRHKTVPADRYSGLFMGLHYVAGFLLVVLVNKLSRGFIADALLRGGLWTLERPWYVATLLFIVFLVYGIIAGLWLLGELIHMTITKSFNIAISGLNFINSRTPDGTVGLIGFVILFLGFFFQMVGTYAGRSR